MSNLTYAVARRSPITVTENGMVQHWGNRAGSQVLTAEPDQLIAAGYGFHVTVGALTTPIVGGGNGTVVDLDQPELAISVPSGTSIRPVRIHVQCELAGDTDADIEEIIIGVDRTQAITGLGTSTAETAFNMRTDNPRSTNCTILSAATANITPSDPVIGMELARRQVTVNLLTAGISHGIFELLYEPDLAPLLVGPCALYVYWGGVAAVSGFAQAQWVEYQSELDGLVNG